MDIAIRGQQERLEQLEDRIETRREELRRREQIISPCARGRELLSHATAIAPQQHVSHFVVDDDRIPRIRGQPLTWLLELSDFEFLNPSPHISLNVVSMGPSAPRQLLRLLLFVSKCFSHAARLQTVNLRNVDAGPREPLNGSCLRNVRPVRDSVEFRRTNRTHRNALPLVGTPGIDVIVASVEQPNDIVPQQVGPVFVEVTDDDTILRFQISIGSLPCFSQRRPFPLDHLFEAAFDTVQLVSVDGVEFGRHAL